MKKNISCSPVVKKSYNPSIEFVALQVDYSLISLMIAVVSSHLLLSANRWKLYSCQLHQCILIQVSCSTSIIQFNRLSALWSKCFFYVVVSSAAKDPQKTGWASHDCGSTGGKDLLIYHSHPPDVCKEKRHKTEKAMLDQISACSGRRCYSTLAGV